MIRPVARAVRGWCRIWIGPPLHVADLVGSVRSGDWELCLIRHRRPGRWTAQELRDIKRRARQKTLDFEQYCD